MKKIFIIDHIDHNAEVEQYGKTCYKETQL